MRLIDADALIPMIKYATTDSEIGIFPIRIGFDTIVKVINEQPTIDAVEVIRCKECKHRKHDTLFGQYWCKGRPVTAEWYCADGERKGESDE